MWSIPSVTGDTAITLKSRRKSLGHLLPEPFDVIGVEPGRVGVSSRRLASRFVHDALVLINQHFVDVRSDRFQLLLNP